MAVKGNLAFLSYIQVWKQRSGRAFGQVADPAAPGTNITSHAYLLEDPINLTFGEITREVATFRGGGQFFGQMRGAITGLGEITWEQAHLDATIRALANRSKIDTTSVSGWTMSGENENQVTLEQVGISIHTRYQDRDSGSDGDNKWLNIIIPQGELTIQRPATLGIAGSDNPAPARATFTPSMAARFPVGVLFGVNQGFHRNRAMGVEIITPYPLALSSYFADGTATTFNLAYLPMFSTVTTGNTNNWVTKNNTPTAPTSINTSNGLVTLAAAGDAADAHRVWYQTEFVPAA